MKSRAIVLGEINESLLEFCKYLIKNDLEVYLALKKNQEFITLKDIENTIPIIRFNDEFEEIRFLLNSIEPKVIYNLYGLEHKNELKELLENSYVNVILFLEALKTSHNTKLINLVDKIQRDDKGNPLTLHTAVLDSLNKVTKFYNDFYNIQALVKFKDEYKI
ncbi:NAD-dependent dehydratase [Clostridium nigeriense]|uniref:NAD-dependent dehydratase n=1 Tax=Clostridium nigeriense TaxID=1805470 RepID=UPI003D349CC1